MHSFDVGVIFSSAKNIQTTVATGSAKYIGGCINTASLGTTCHPIYTFNYHVVFHSEKLFLFLSGLSAASCFIAAYTACAFCCFATIWAHTSAFVDKVSAIYATRLFFFTQSSSPLLYLLYGLKEFKVSEKPVLLFLHVQIYSKLFHIH